MNKNEIESRYEISKPNYGDGYNVSLKLSSDTLLVGLISNKEDAAKRIEQIRQFGSSERNFYVFEMEDEDSFYFKLSASDKLYRDDILAGSDMLDSRSDLESLIKKVMRESKTTSVVDITEV
ncbi:hypothetical protein L1D13_18030 [Vibrio tubiashii]|uniref:hypothetical protein n=1 Tax=Vibrio tubiashii TaxID=29498 RepID=UPI001EFD43A2|nr:hypothetical protein [Vibrio tubiashii]MCG9580879.1 hypothetical protein [Vibrio tubiashii]MCG9614470.1 hypothetical protein [Vibrio tubiashii]MCG9688804.1 hypothetical protein [Vibrio tubiashii]